MVDEHSTDPAPEHGEAGPVRGDQDTPDMDRDLAQLRVEMSIEQLRHRRTATERSRSEVRAANLLVGSIDRTATIWLVPGGTISGHVVEVGRDYLCMEPATGPVWISLDVVAAVRTPVDPGTAPSATSTVGVGLLDILEDLIVAEREINVVLCSGEAITGMPTAVGQAMTLRHPTGFVLVPLHAVATVSLGVRPRDS